MNWGRYYKRGSIPADDMMRGPQSPTGYQATSGGGLRSDASFGNGAMHVKMQQFKQAYPQLRSAVKNFIGSRPELRQAIGAAIKKYRNR